MTNHSIDNSVSGLRKVVLWQYDKAYRLLTVLHLMKTFYEGAVASFWTNWVYDVLNINTCTEFGLSIWGMLIGIKRPTITEVIAGEKVVRAIDLPTYRRVLKATFFFMKASSSSTDLVGNMFNNDDVKEGYLQILFTPESAASNAKDYEPNVPFAIGDIVKHGSSYYKCKTFCPASVNTSWEAIVDMFVSYCGVVIIDNLDMSISYAKTDSFNDMSYDQKALYEQIGELVLHYPLGIKDNNRIGKVYFGLATQYTYAGDVYEAGTPIAMHQMVIYTDEAGTNIYEAMRGISSAENKNWESIKSMMVKLEIAEIQEYQPNITLQRPIAYRKDNNLYTPKEETIPQQQNTSWDDVNAHMQSLYWRGQTLQKVILTGPFSLDNAIDYQPNIGYSIGDVVKHGGSVFYCIADITQIVNDSWDSVKDFFQPCWENVIFSSTATPYSE